MDLSCSRQILLIHTFKGLARDFLKEMIFNFRGEAVVLTSHTLLRIYGPALSEQWALRCDQEIISVLKDIDVIGY